MTEHEQRQRVVAAAYRWCGTPYRHHARLHGAGADCATLMAAIYQEALGLRINLPPYSQQWFMHRSEELYLAEVMRYCREIDGPPGPGDVAVWRIGRCYAHGAVVVGWPTIVHAYQAAGFVLEANGLGGALAHHRSGPQRGQPREVRFFSPWGRGNELDIPVEQAGKR